MLELEPFNSYKKQTDKENMLIPRGKKQYAARKYFCFLFNS